MERVFFVVDIRRMARNVLFWHETQAPRHPVFPSPGTLGSRAGTSSAQSRHSKEGNVRIAIVEDHPAERELIATMCAEYFNGRNVGATAGRNAMQTVCDVFPDAKSFIESWKNSRYDLLLLDCYLSDENLPHATTGLDIARLLRNQNDDCAIVFITSSTDFAVLGYEVQASGYLLKPVNRKTFEATMERVEEQLKAKPPVTHLAKAQSPGTVDSS